MYGIMYESDQGKFFYWDNPNHPSEIWTEDISKMKKFSDSPLSLLHCLCQWHPRKDIRIVCVKTLIGPSHEQPDKNEKSHAPRPAKTTSEPYDPKTMTTLEELRKSWDKSFKMFEAMQKRYGAE